LSIRSRRKEESRGFFLPICGKLTVQTIRLELQLLIYYVCIRSVRYLNENPDILILDCTYKTNKFGMPLLDILGVDGLDQGFTVGVAFLNGETEEDYGWSMTHLRSLFQQGIWPSVIATDCDEALMHAVESMFPPAQSKMVLCFWHVSMNVVTNCKKFFETERLRLRQDRGRVRRHRQRVEGRVPLE
jgi:MULE transposase domain